MNDERASQPPRDPAEHDRAVLIRSIVATLALGVLGVVWGILGGSRMILLDGVYAIVGIALSVLLLRASALATRGPTRRYPYGLAAATPLAIAIQGFVLLGALLYAAVEAVAVIRGGGSGVAAGWAMVYSLVAAGASIVVWRWLASVAGTSDVLISEAAAWRVGMLRGVFMVVGFGVMALVERSGWSALTPYVDPVMVLVSCVMLVPGPLDMVRTTIGELLEAAPPAATQEAIRSALDATRAEFDLDKPDLYTTKVGPRLYVEVDGTAGPDVTIAQEHQVRESLRARLDELPYEIWLNVELRPRDGIRGEPR